MVTTPTSPQNRTSLDTGPAGTRDDVAKFVLRVALGLLILVHGISKVQSGPGFVIGVVSKAGLPPALGYLVYVGEVLAPLLLVVGLFTRAAALVVAINMLFAIGLVRAPQIFTIAPTGGWAIELEALFLIVAIVVALQGAGRYSVGGVAGRWN